MRVTFPRSADYSHLQVRPGQSGLRLACQMSVICHCQLTLRGRAAAHCQRPWRRSVHARVGSMWHPACGRALSGLAGSGASITGWELCFGTQPLGCADRTGCKVLHLQPLHRGSLRVLCQPICDMPPPLTCAWLQIKQWQQCTQRLFQQSPQDPSSGWCGAASNKTSGWAADERVQLRCLKALLYI